MYSWNKNSVSKVIREIVFIVKTEEIRTIGPLLRLKEVIVSPSNGRVLQENIDRH